MYQPPLQPPTQLQTISAVLALVFFLVTLAQSFATGLHPPRHGHPGDGCSLPSVLMLLSEADGLSVEGCCETIMLYTGFVPVYRPHLAFMLLMTRHAREDRGEELGCTNRL